MNAYLDPGSGSMLLGLFASGLAGIVVLFKTFGHRVVSVLTFWRKDEDKAEATVATSEGETEQESAPSST